MYWLSKLGEQKIRSLQKIEIEEDVHELEKNKR